MKRFLKIFFLLSLVAFVTVSCANSSDGGSSGGGAKKDPKPKPQDTTIKSSDGFLFVTPKDNGLLIKVDLSKEAAKYWKHININVRDISDGEECKKPVVAQEVEIKSDGDERYSEMLFPFVSKGGRYKVWFTHMGAKGDEWGNYTEKEATAVKVDGKGGLGEIFVFAEEERCQYWSPAPRLYLSRLSVSLPSALDNAEKVWWVHGEKGGNVWSSEALEMDFPYVAGQHIIDLDSFHDANFDPRGEEELFFCVRFQTKYEGLYYHQELFGNYDRFYADSRTVEDHQFPLITIMTPEGEEKDNAFVTEPVAKHVKEAQQSWGDYSNENAPDPYYVTCKISVDGGEGLDGQVKVRGNWTTNYTKKSLRIKFDQKQNLCGLHEGKKYKNWVLLAGFKDASLLRDAVAFQMYKDLFGDTRYSSDFELVEVQVNDVYMGVYLLAEQQEAKRMELTEPADKNDISKDIGYLVEFDSYYYTEKENERFEIDYLGDIKDYNGNTLEEPQNGYTIKSDINHKDQHDFIENYMNMIWEICYKAVYEQEYKAIDDSTFSLVTLDDNYFQNLAEPLTTDSEKCQHCVEKYIDLSSLVDMYIFSELVCDPDLYLTSFFMDVDFGPSAQDNLLYFEAPWDFDSTMGNKSFALLGDGSNESEDKVNLSFVNEPFAAFCQTDVNCHDGKVHANPWMVIFINEPWFKDMVQTRWDGINKATVLTNAETLIHDYSVTLNQPVFEYTRALWGNPSMDGELCEASREAAENSQEASANYLKTWLQNRFSYVDSIIGGL